VTDAGGGGLEHLAGNQAYWNDQAPDYAAAGRRNWQAEPSWGMWGIPDAEVGGIFDDVDGLDAVELGCGTGYMSAWISRRGGRPVGIDPTAGQLATARALQTELGPRFPLVRAAGEAVPLRDGSFDLAISEYGAAIWADPYRWIPEAARLLRPGGELVFLGNAYLMMLCVPDEDGLPAGRRLLRPHFGMHRFDWPDDPSVEFHLPHGEWIRLFRTHGFVVEDLVEVRAPEGATTRDPYVTPEWANQWPSEEIWRVRKR
jgi:SAM-dependent methyltransferase